MITAGGDNNAVFLPRPDKIEPRADLFAGGFYSVADAAKLVSLDAVSARRNLISAGVRVFYVIRI